MLWADSGRAVYFVPPPKRSNLDLCALWCLLSLAPANWLLWEPCTATHSHTVDDILANTHRQRTYTHRQRTSQPSGGGLAHTGAPLLLLSQLSAQEMFEVPPAVLFDQLHRVVSCHCNFANLHWLISVWAATALTRLQPPHFKLQISITQVLHSIFHKDNILTQSPFYPIEIIH